MSSPVHQHEITDVARVLLRSGIMAPAIDQDPVNKARLAVELALEHLDVGRKRNECRRLDISACLNT